MFKASYFKYADIYSGKYNLIMAYVSRNQNFITGAEYEPMIDTLPSRAESLLYGIKYSEKPLEFEVDIVNPDEDIPMKQMMEIKDWLFGQDGWKKLYIKSPDYENMYLKCLFLPENDIRDSSGYRGVRCKVKNISGFWYGKDEVITYTKSDFDILTDNGTDIPEDGKVIVRPEIKTQCKEKVYPIIQFNVDDYNSLLTYVFNIHNTKTDYESDFTMKLVASQQNKVGEVDCLYGDVNINGGTVIPTLDTNYDFFYMEKGVNEVAINVLDNSSSSRSYCPPDFISFIYTPKLRVGGF